MPLAPTPDELTLARGVLALIRVHDEASDPSTWTVEPVPWGDGRWAFEIRGTMTVDGAEVSALVCTLRPSDIDATEQSAVRLVAAAERSAEVAREVISRQVVEMSLAEAEQPVAAPADLADAVMDRDLRIARELAIGELNSLASTCKSAIADIAEGFALGSTTRRVLSETGDAVLAMAKVSVAEAQIKGAALVRSLAEDPA